MSSNDESVARIERHGDVRVVAPKVPLRREHLEDLQSAIGQSLDRVALIVIDLSHVGLIDGSGLEWLLAMDDTAASRGGCVRLCGAADLCSDILRITSVGSRLHVADNLTECLAEMAI